MQSCPGFLLKSVLESPGNILEICSVKFVDTLELDQNCNAKQKSWPASCLLPVSDCSEFTMNGHCLGN